MSTETPAQLTGLLSAQLAHAFAGQVVKVFVAPSGNINSLVIQVFTPLPQFKTERTMFGKTIRLLNHLQDRCQLSVLLKDYRLSKVMVTEAPNPQLSNKQNTTILNSSFLFEMFQQWEVIKLAGDIALETAVKSFIISNQDSQ